MSCTSLQVPAPPLRVTRGESKTFRFTVRDAQKQPVDLTNAKVWFTVKARLEDAAAVIAKKNATAGGVDGQALVSASQTGGTKGQFSVFLTPPDTAGFDPELTSSSCDAWVQLAAYAGTSTSVGAGTLTDTAQTFVVNALAGGILRDSAGSSFLILSNTGTVITVNGNPAAGAYAVYLGKRYQVMKNRGFIVDPAVTTTF